jgi:hypothetical protein
MRSRSEACGIFGITFARYSNAHLVLRFGPFLTAHCRMQDCEERYLPPSRGGNVQNRQVDRSCC